ncbi:hypothetical protein RFI_00773 [Reticulomyxa filosa]|uniref:Transmembrane protein n=1 Tax=Reticulomyxa filosa TaxID=46433 RepID=X6PDV4_RETFI|nr:hypothetical protein RFI_00773 [Reticulomyxa filosa]|eukprot:ETO36288.1 hypothetical protein RFI_00773 [Reticulomyxa filosa]
MLFKSFFDNHFKTFFHHLIRHFNLQYFASSLAMNVSNDVIFFYNFLSIANIFIFYNIIFCLFILKFSIFFFANNLTINKSLKIISKSQIKKKLALLIPSLNQIITNSNEKLKNIQPAPFCSPPKKEKSENLKLGAPSVKKFSFWFFSFLDLKNFYLNKFLQKRCVFYFIFNCCFKLQTNINLFRINPFYCFFKINPNLQIKYHQKRNYLRMRKVIFLRNCKISYKIQNQIFYPHKKILDRFSISKKNFVVPNRLLLDATSPETSHFMLQELHSLHCI